MKNGLGSASARAFIVCACIVGAFCAQTARASTSESGAISGDVVWDTSGSPYIVSNVTIPSGSSLTILPGVVIKSNYYLFNVSGTLTIGALGQAPVVITSYNDDSVGGDTNGDGNATTPAAGDWRFMSINAGSHVSISNTSIRYGGYKPCPYDDFQCPPTGAILISGGDLSLDTASISDSRTFGIQQKSGTLAVNNSSFFNEGENQAINVNGGTTTIIHSLFTDLGVNAVDVGAATALRFGGNVLANSMITIYDTPFQNDGGNTGTGAIRLNSLIAGDQVLVPDSVPYTTFNHPHIQAGHTVTVLPGVVVKGMPNSELFDIVGSLQVGKNGKDPVIFTSMNDDSALGDSNGDGNASTPQPGDWQPIVIEGGGSLDVQNAQIKYGGCNPAKCSIQGEVWNSGGSITIDHALFSNAPEGITQGSGTLVVTNSEIQNVGRAITVNDGTATVHQSTMHDITSPYVMANNAPNPIDATNNWWGDPTGPFNLLSNPQGQAPRVTDNINFIPFLSSDPLTASTVAVCKVDCNDNVLFIPGIEASRLYEMNAGQERKLWEPGSNADALQLQINPDGSSVNKIYTRDVIDNAYAPLKGNIYESFIADMNNLKSQGKINDWASAPYDWRLTLDQILSSGKVNANGISYLQATSTPFIEQELRQLAATSRTGKVTIVTHSNGGLVAKALMQAIGGPATSQLVDKVIFVASPQVGTPFAIAGLLHGYMQAMPSESFKKINDTTAREVGDSFPGLYMLLPSASYFAHVDDPVVTISTSTLVSWAGAYGDIIHSQARLSKFLTDTMVRTQPAVNDLSDPTILSDNFLNQAEIVHQALDAWVPPAGVKVIQIAGWGMPTTVSGIDYATVIKNGTVQIEPKPRFVIDGDGTVVVPSALWMSTTTGVEDYWLDLSAYNKNHPFATVNGVFAFNHGNIFEVTPLMDFIDDSILQDTHPLASYGYLYQSAPHANPNLKRLRFSLHSPLMLNLYDDQGNHTGISTSTGEVDEQIPGTYYTEFGNVKYIFTDADSASHIIMNGYADGTFTFDVNEYEGNTLVASTTFQDIPTIVGTKVTINTTSDISTLSPMHIDLDGDGNVDYNLSPKTNGIVMLDTTPPEIVIGFSTSTNTLSVSGTDESGIVTTFATTMYPSLKKGQKTYQGIATTSVTAVDGSGNATVLTYTEKLPQADRREAINLVSISYNGVVTMLGVTTLKYKWAFNADGSYKMFASYILTSATSTEAHWRPKKNITIVMTKPQDFDDSDSDDDVDARPVKTKLTGFASIGIRTNYGKAVVSLQ